MKLVTPEQRGKLVLCISRTIGTIMILALVIAGAKWLELDYEDVKTILTIFNSYFPQLVALVIFATAFFVFYRASIDEKNAFTFANFFKAGKAEDMGRLGYFLLLLAAIWSIFAMYWRERLTAEYIGVLLTAFIVKNVADTIGKSFGNSRSESHPPAPPATGGTNA